MHPLRYEQMMQRMSRRFDDIVSGMVTSGGAPMAALAFERFEQVLAEIQRELSAQQVLASDKELVAITTGAFVRSSRRFYRDGDRVDQTKKMLWDQVKEELFGQLRRDHEAATSRTRELLMQGLGISPGQVAI